MNLQEIYDDSFYGEQAEGSYKSAKRVVGYINELFAPKSVIDVGCGIGTWLKAYSEQNCEIKIAGIDGNASHALHIISAQNYKQVDFTQGWQKVLRDVENAFCNGGGGNTIDADKLSESSALNSQATSTNSQNFHKFDLAQSLEVAEHLPEQYADDFVRLLTELSDVVLFSAAIPYQGGTHHINEREPQYWADIFTKYNFVCFDILRDIFWNDENIEFWYKQNILLFVNKNNQAVMQTMKNKGFLYTNHPKLLVHFELLKGHQASASYFKNKLEKSLCFKTKRFIKQTIKSIFKKH